MAVPVLILTLLVQAFAVKPYRIPSASMAPTIDVGERVLVSRTADPGVGDIVIFHPPAGAELNECGVAKPPDQACPRPTPERSRISFIKRVVAGPGDRLRIVDGRVIRNGRRLAEPYIRPCAGGEECSLPRELRVPRGHFFVLGDNRGASDDSRFWGPVREAWITGVVIARYWPPGKIGAV